MGPDVIPSGKTVHGAGHAGSGPARRPAGPKGAQNYDQPLDNLIGFLAGTDSQRVAMHEDMCARQTAADVWFDLEQRAKAEQWYLRMQVPALELNCAPTRGTPPSAAVGPVCQPCRRRNNVGIVCVCRRWKRFA